MGVSAHTFLAPHRVPNPLKWHGGKYYLAEWLIGLMPPHQNYVEPFAGGYSFTGRG
jgi:site-specific DNA-adenine methylase